MEQLLELREPGLEPGQASAREHLASCEVCQAESDRVAQRVARLKALPVPRPARDQFLEIRRRHVKAQRLRTLARAVPAVLAIAATVALVVMIRPAGGPDDRTAVQDGSTAGGQLDEMMARSQALEETLRRYDPDSRAIDGRTAAIAARIEDQLGALDRQIELLDMMDGTDPMRNTRQLRLWRERVGLLDALVDVHFTRASFAGL